MSTPATIFSDASFPQIGRDAYLVPIGKTNPPAGLSEPVDLSMSDGTTVRVFGSLRVALRCLEAMRQRRQAFLSASDDVFVYAVSWTKLLVCEATLTNQRLLSSYSPSYVAGHTVFTHRSLSSVVGLAEALSTVGFSLGNATLQGNADLRAANAGIQLVDWNFRLTDAGGAGSRLDDASPLLYSFAAPLQTADTAP